MAPGRVTEAVGTGNIPSVDNVPDKTQPCTWFQPKHTAKLHISLRKHDSGLTWGAVNISCVAPESCTFVVLVSTCVVLFCYALLTVLSFWS